MAFAEKLEQAFEADSLGMFIDDVRLVQIRDWTAWVCDGTRFTEHGNWTTYFTYDLDG